MREFKDLKWLNHLIPTRYQRQKNKASQATTPEQLRDSHSAATSAKLEDSIGEELTAQSSRDQASSSRDKRINDESKFV